MDRPTDDDDAATNAQLQHLVDVYIELQRCRHECKQLTQMYLTPVRERMKGIQTEYTELGAAVMEALKGMNIDKAVLRREGKGFAVKINKKKKKKMLSLAEIEACLAQAPVVSEGIVHGVLGPEGAKEAMAAILRQNPQCTECRYCIGVTLMNPGVSG